MMPCKHREELPLVSRSCAIVGGIVGLGLSAVAVTWVLVANRDVELFPFAVDRNVSAAALMGLCMLAPVFVFLKYPTRIFTSGMVAWLILTVTYFVMTTRYHDLEARLGTFHLFMLGVLAYALAAAFVWVLHSILTASRHPLPTRRRYVAPR
jgi:uncharacterized membrane protein YvlD (DUF360 family)